MENITFPLKRLVVRFKEWESTIPYYVIKGKKSGPKMFISAGIHGSEINGIATVRTFLEQAQSQNIQETLKGTIYVFPVINISGFNKMERRVQEDGQDLNRAFGKSPAKSFTEALADTLTTKIFSKCNFGIDIHDAGGNSVLMPHVRIHKKDPDFMHRSLGRAFGTKILIRRKGNKHMMAEYLRAAHNVPVITVELGGAQMTDAPSINEGIKGIQNILIFTKMMKGEMQLRKKQYLLTDRIGVKTSQGGEIHIHKKLGEKVEAGEEIGWIYFPQTQKKEILTAPTCGFVFSKWVRNQIPKNSVMYGIIEETVCQEAKTEALDELEQIPEFYIKEFNFSG